MVLSNRSNFERNADETHNQQPGNLARRRLAAQLFNGHGHSGESVRVYEIAAKCQLDEESILRVLREFQTLGMVTLSGKRVGESSMPLPQKRCCRLTRSELLWRKSPDEPQRRR